MLARGYKTLSMLDSTEHGINHVHLCSNANNIFISMINTAFESLKANILFYEQNIIHAQLSCIASGPDICYGKCRRMTPDTESRLIHVYYIPIL